MRIFALAFLLLAGCESVPKVHIKVWIGESDRQDITRVDIVNGQPVRTEIKTSDPRFDGSVVFLNEPYEDSFPAFYYNLTSMCVKWKDGVQMLTPNETLDKFFNPTE